MGTEQGRQTRDICGLPWSRVTDGLPLHNLLQKRTFYLPLISSWHGGGGSWQTPFGTWAASEGAFVSTGAAWELIVTVQGTAGDRMIRANLTFRSGSKMAFEGLFCYFKFSSHLQERWPLHWNERPGYMCLLSIGLFQTCFQENHSRRNSAPWAGKLTAHRLSKSPKGNSSDGRVWDKEVHVKGSLHHRGGTASLPEVR